MKKSHPYLAALLKKGGSVDTTTIPDYWRLEHCFSCGELQPEHVQVHYQQRDLEYKYHLYKERNGRV